LRIIAGSLGGRRLVAPRGLATRPTSDRVREALFSALGEISGARVLDLFAGTGALGLEALSRGAARATFVDNARPALQALRENIAALDVGDRATVVAEPALRAVGSLAGPFDLVFIDPPYAALDAVPPLVATLDRALLPGATVVLEHASRDPQPRLGELEGKPARVYGDTALSIYRKASTDPRSM
jgi:16S rRNA (guanine(966)-N(2))-methyltransferase RsmD